MRNAICGDCGGHYLDARVKVVHDSDFCVACLERRMRAGMFTGRPQPAPSAEYIPPRCEACGERIPSEMAALGRCLACAGNFARANRFNEFTQTENPLSEQGSWTSGPYLGKIPLEVAPEDFSSWSPLGNLWSRLCISCGKKFLSLTSKDVCPPCNQATYECYSCGPGATHDSSVHPDAARKLLCPEHYFETNAVGAVGPSVTPKGEAILLASQQAEAARLLHLAKGREAHERLAEHFKELHASLAGGRVIAELHDEVIVEVTAPIGGLKDVLGERLAPPPETREEKRRREREERARAAAQEEDPSVRRFMLLEIDDE